MAATLVGCAPPASLTSGSTQLQLHVAGPRCTVTLTVSPERKAKGAGGEKQRPQASLCSQNNTRIEARERGGVVSVFVESEGSQLLPLKFNATFIAGAGQEGSS